MLNKLLEMTTIALLLVVSFIVIVGGCLGVAYAMVVDGYVILAAIFVVLGIVTYIGYLDFVEKWLWN